MEITCTVNNKCIEVKGYGRMRPNIDYKSRVLCESYALKRALEYTEKLMLE